MSEPTYMRNAVYFEATFTLCVLFKQANRPISLKVLLELDRIEFDFNDDILKTCTAF